MVVEASLNNLFTKDWFDICTVDSVLKVLQVSESSEAYKLLRTLHCVHYSKMSRDLRETLPHLVREAMTPQRVGATESALQGVNFGD